MAESKQVSEKTEMQQGDSATKDDHKKSGRSSVGPGDSRDRFSIRTESSEVKKLMEQKTEPELKVKEVYARFQSLVKEYKRLEKRLNESQRKIVEVSHNRDSMQSELTKTTLAKSKLETLCRELQKQNKSIQEESRQRAYDEEQKRKDVSAKFQTTIDEVAGKLHDHYERNQELKEENQSLAQQLKSIVEQYEKRETNFEKLLQQKQLEFQLVEAKMAQQKATFSQERETKDTQIQLLKVQILEYQKKCELLTEQETELKKQLGIYSEKFDEFQGTLTKSNEVFSTFRKEMDRMSKAVSNSEKEITQWKAKYNKCNKSLLELAESQVNTQEALQAEQTKNSKLESLCRALQKERKSLREKLKSPSPPLENEVESKETEKVAS